MEAGSLGHLQTYLHCLARNCEDHILSQYLKRGWSVQYIVEVTAAPSLPTPHKCLGYHENYNVLIMIRAGSSEPCQ